jgi:M6 family metalloprotease-like protein
MNIILKITRIIGLFFIALVISGCDIIDLMGTSDDQTFLDKQIAKFEFKDINSNFKTQKLADKTAYLITQPLSLFKTRDSDDTSHGIIKYSWESSNTNVLKNDGSYSTLLVDATVVFKVTMKIKATSSTKEFTLLFKHDKNLIDKKKKQNDKKANDKKANDKKIIDTNKKLKDKNATKVTNGKNVTSKKDYDKKIIKAKQKFTMKVLIKNNKDSSDIKSNLNFPSIFEDVNLTYTVTPYYDTDKIKKTFIDTNGNYVNNSAYWSELEANGTRNQIFRYKIRVHFPSLNDKSIAFVNFKDFRVVVRQPLIVLELPTIVMVVSNNDYQENDPTIWSDKFFGNGNSLKKYYSKETLGQMVFVPAKEPQGRANDGIVMINTSEDHPGNIAGSSKLKDELKKWLRLADRYVNYAQNTPRNGDVLSKKLNIIFVLAGGESAAGDPASSSIWAHASWFWKSDIEFDNVTLFNYKSGKYSIFGSNHKSHKATLGIIAHEIGHAVFNIGDYYDTSNKSSGIGHYDLMASGNWGKKPGDSYYGQTSAGISGAALDKANLNSLTYLITGAKNTKYNNIEDKPKDGFSTYTISCEKPEAVKINLDPKVATDFEESFIIDCRNVSTDKTFLNYGFQESDMFLTVYHSSSKYRSNKSVFNGVEHHNQTYDYHYSIAMIEGDDDTRMTHKKGVKPSVNDVYFNGHDTIRLPSFFQENSSYLSIDILSEDLENKTMTFRVNY